MFTHYFYVSWLSHNLIQKGTMPFTYIFSVAPLQNDYALYLIPAYRPHIISKKCTTYTKSTPYRFSMTVCIDYLTQKINCMYYITMWGRMDYWWIDDMMRTMIYLQLEFIDHATFLQNSSPFYEPIVFCIESAGLYIS